MSFWDEGPKAHAIFSQVVAVQAAHDVAAPVAAEDPTASKLLGRLRAVLAGANTVLLAADPLMVPESVIGAASGALGTWANEVTTFTTNRDAAHLLNAQAQAEQLLSLIGQIPINPALLKKGAIASTVQELVKTISEREAAIAADRSARDAKVSADRAAREATVQAERQAEQAQVAKLTSDVAELAHQVTQTRAEVVSQVSTHQQQFSTAQDARSAEFGKAQDDRAREHLTTLTDAKTEIAGVVNDKKRSLDEAIAAATSNVAEWRSGADALLADRDSAFQRRVDEVLAALTTRKVEADELVGLIGERGVTSNYQKVANEARLEMYGWHVLTVAALGAFVWVAIVKFVPALQGGWNWGAFAGRFFVATALTLFATYAGAQARSSREVMRKNRQREMDIKAIEPYLATLPPEMRQSIKVQFANRTFISPDDASTSSALGDDMLKDPKVQEILVGLVKTAMTEFAKSK